MELTGFGRFLNTLRNTNVEFYGKILILQMYRSWHKLEELNCWKSVSAQKKQSAVFQLQCSEPYLNYTILKIRSKGLQKFVYGLWYLKYIRMDQISSIHQLLLTSSYSHFFGYADVWSGNININIFVNRTNYNGKNEVINS